eukprot:8532630-Pyramimonas_sp.AAC.1
MRPKGLKSKKVLNSRFGQIIARLAKFRGLRSSFHGLMKIVRGGALPAGLFGTCVRGMADSRIKGPRAALAHASFGAAKGRSRTL